MPNCGAAVDVSASANPNEDKPTAYVDDVEITGYRVNNKKRCITWFFVLLTCGILRLILHWRSDWFLFWTHELCGLSRADSILVRDPYKQYFVVPIEVCTRSGRRLRRGRGLLPLARALFAKRRKVDSVKQRASDSFSKQLDVADGERDEAAPRPGCEPTIVEEEASFARQSVAGAPKAERPTPDGADEIVRVVTIRCDQNTDARSREAEADTIDGAELRDTVCIQLETARSSSAARHVDVTAPLLGGGDSGGAGSRGVARVRRASHRAYDSLEDEPASDTDDGRPIRFFVDRNVKYVFDEQAGCFKKVTGLGLDHAGSFLTHYNDDFARKQTEITGSTFHDVYVTGVDIRTRQRRAALYGRNVVDVELTPVAKLLVREILHPFYIFQVLSCIIWYTDQYEYFATAILVTSVVSIAVATFQTRRMQRNLRAMLDERCPVAVKVPSDDQVLDAASWRRLIGDVDSASVYDRNLPDEPDADAASVGLSRPTPSSTKRRKMTTIGSSQSESDEEAPDDVFLVTAAAAAAAAGGRPDGVNESVLSAKSTGFNDSVRSRRSVRSGSGRRQRTASTNRRSASTLLRADDVDELDASSSRVRTVRGGVFRTIASDLLVPGDVIEVPRGGCVMQCDAVLIAGQCIVNESSLTGESVPVTKTPIACDAPANSFNDARSTTGTTPTHSEMFTVKTHARHILFGGTRVIQTRYFESQRVLAIVIRTGFMTSKGELIRSILFPKPVDFKFIRQSFQFVLVLSAMAALGTIYTGLVMMLRNGEGIVQTLRYVLNLVTVAIPPSLPAAMTVGIVFAQARLKRSQIYCIAPNSINVSGSIDLVCFDKTGTLTEDGLDVHGLWPVAGLGLPTDRLPQTISSSSCQHARERLASTRTRHGSHSSRADEQTAPNGSSAFSGSRRSRKRTFTGGHESVSERDDRQDSNEHDLLVDERAQAGELPAGFGSMLQPEAFGQLPVGSLLLEALAACHSLTKLNGALCGDPLDVKQFEAVGWDLSEPGDDEHRYEMMCPSVVHPKRRTQSPPPAPAPAPVPPVTDGVLPTAAGDAVVTLPGGNDAGVAEPCAVSEQQSVNALLENPCLTESIRKELGEETWPYEIGILRQLVFVNALQRSSVIVRVLGEKDCKLYVKGAPELIASLCHRESIPPAFHALLSEHTRKGYRVLAFAYRRLPSDHFSYTRLMRLNREALECDLEFLGLLVLENRLKAETRGVIRLLNASRIRSVMVTGDNLLTALSVARDCEMIAADEQIVIVSTNTPATTKGQRSEPRPTSNTTLSVSTQPDALDEAACIARFLRFRAESGTELAISVPTGRHNQHQHQRDVRSGPAQQSVPTQPAIVGNTLQVAVGATSDGDDMAGTQEELAERPSVCSYTERRKTVYWQNRISFAMTGECWQYLHEAWTFYASVCDAHSERLRNSRSCAHQSPLPLALASPTPNINVTAATNNTTTTDMSLAVTDCPPAYPDRTPPGSSMMRSVSRPGRPCHLFTADQLSDLLESPIVDDTKLAVDEDVHVQDDQDNSTQAPVRVAAAKVGAPCVTDEDKLREAATMLPLLNAVLANTVVCARMLPEQKQQLIERLQAQHNYVAMCGDGANDTGALKAAHTGISLSEAEASVAAPFTSKRPTIECVPTVIREGRCALVTSFGVFKFIACYSLTQFLTVLMLYYANLNLSDWQYFYIDLAVVMSLSITIGRTRAADSLSRRRPMTDLVNFSTIMSIITQVLIVGLVQSAALWLIMQQPYYFEPHPQEINHEEHFYRSFNNTVLFSVSLFQYVVLALVYAKGKPHRAPAYTNFWFLLNVLVLLAASSVVLIYQGPQFVGYAFQLHQIESLRFKCLLALLVVANLLASYLVEEYVFDNAELRRACRALIIRYNAKLRTVFSGSAPPFALASRRNAVAVSSTSASDGRTALPTAVDYLKRAERTYNTVTMNREMDTLHFLEEPISRVLLSFKS